MQKLYFSGREFQLGEEEIRENLKKAYGEIITWRKNIMPVPRGKNGEAFIRELTKLINLFVHKTAWERLAFLAVHVFVPLMLQKPSAFTKAYHIIVKRS